MAPPTVRSGDVYYLRTLADKEGHWHAIVNVHPDGDHLTLVYGTSSESDKQAGASVLHVQPGSVAAPGLQLPQPTYFVASALVVASTADLEGSRGHIGGLLPDLRKTIREAIGHGTGPGWATRIAGGKLSLRGQVVRLKDSAIGTSAAIVVTSHVYSTQEQWQIIVPLFRSRSGTSSHGFVHLKGSNWIPMVFGADVASVHAATILTQSVWHPSRVATVLRQSVQETELKAVEDSLCTVLGI